jgi:NTP pyrophosphatase (non-canonical NTP hydrolase)
MTKATASDDATPLAALKAKVAAFVEARDWAQYHAPKNLAMAIACEAAELMELFLWMDAPASRAIGGERRARVEAEAADVAICLLNLCNVLGIDLSAALERKLAEADAKYPAERVRGRAEKYSEYGDEPE